MSDIPADAPLDFEAAYATLEESVRRLESGTLNLAEMRAVSDIPLDLYVEAPDAMGGVVRGEQAADLIRVAAPLYVKFGLRNSRGLYPSGMHVQADAELIGREKVRRAQIAMEWIERSGIELTQSAAHAPGLGIPKP